MQNFYIVDFQCIKNIFGKLYVKSKTSGFFYLVIIELIFIFVLAFQKEQKQTKKHTNVEKKTYTYDDAFKASVDYFNGDELAARVWVNKYAMKDSFGAIYEKSPEDMHWRIANEIARVEAKYSNPMSAQEVYDLLDHFKYVIPSGSPMTGIGNDYQIASL